MTQEPNQSPERRRQLEAAWEAGNRLRLATEEAQRLGFANIQELDEAIVAAARKRGRRHE